MRIPFTEAVSSGIDSSYPRFVDKFEMSVKLGAFEFPAHMTPVATQEEFSSLGRLIGRVANARGTEAEISHSPYLEESNLSTAGGWIFNSYTPQENHTKYYKYRVASRDRGGDYDIPFFSGSMELNKIRSEVTLDFSFNAMRFARYNGLARIASNSDAGERMVGLPRLGASAAYKQAVADRILNSSDEFSYDQEADNWLTSSRMAGSQWEEYPHSLREYVGGVERAVAQEMDRASLSLPDPAFAPTFHHVESTEGKYSLGYCEIAFEFSSENPKQTLAELEPLLQGYAKNGMTAREYSCPYEVEEQAGGWIKSYVLHLPREVDLALYAKTNKRIRVEVRYFLSKDSGVLGANTGIRANNIERVNILVSRLMRDAQGKVNDLFQHLRELEIVITETSKSVPELIMDVHEHALHTCGGNKSVVNAILQQLATTGSLRTVRGGNRQVNVTLQRMLDRVPKVIQRTNSRGRYIPAADYSWAVSKLGEEEFWQRCVTIPEPDSEE